MSQELGDLLVQQKIITPQQLDKAIRAQRDAGKTTRLGSILVQMGFVTDDEVTSFLSRQYGVPAIDLRYFEIDPAVIKLVPEETSRRYQILPLSRVGASLTIAMVDPSNVFAIDDIKFMTGFNIEPVVAPESAILETIQKAYGQPTEEENVEELLASIELEAEPLQVDLPESEKTADEAPVTRLVNIILSNAIKRGASDIHIEPYENEYRVRFRIDGVLQHIMSPPIALKDAITFRIKIMAKMDISEKRLPQDGRIMLKMQVGGKKEQLDIRVNCLPTLWGEKIVLRLLGTESLRLDMTKLGFDSQALERKRNQNAMSSDPDLLQRVAEKLGLRNHLKADADLVAAIENRLPLRVISVLVEHGVQEKEIYSLIVPRRTLQHRRARREKLTVEESDRVVRVVRIITLAERVFADPEAAMRWLRAAKKRFGGRTALEMLATEAGSRMAEEMLYQIDEGMAA